METPSNSGLGQSIARDYVPQTKITLSIAKERHSNIKFSELWNIIMQRMIQSKLH